MTHHTASAHLWDGVRRLPGVLTLSESELVFEVVAFPDADFIVKIAFENIAQAEMMLIFDFHLHGLLLTERDGKQHCFILDEPADFLNKLNKYINK
jgi:hypothetical protein